MTVESIKNNPLVMLSEMVKSIKSGVDLNESDIELIKENKSLILKVNKSSIKEQMDLMFEANDPVKSIKLLFDSGIATSLFKNKREFDDDIQMLAEDVETLADFYSIICFNNPTAFKKVLGGDNETAKAIKAIGSVFIGISEMGMNLTDEGKYRVIGYDAMRISKEVANSGIIPNFMKKAIASLDNITYPASPKDFVVKTSDIQNVKKIKESEVPKLIQTMVISVMIDKYPYDKDVLLEIYRRGLFNF